MGITKKFQFDMFFEGDNYVCKAKRFNAIDGLKYNRLSKTYREIAEAYNKDNSGSYESLMDTLQEQLELAHKYITSWDLCDDDGEGIDLPRTSKEFIELCNELGFRFSQSVVLSLEFGHFLLEHPDALKGTEEKEAE
jgi:hypothetical protein